MAATEASGNQNSEAQGDLKWTQWS